MSHRVQNQNNKHSKRIKTHRSISKDLTHTQRTYKTNEKTMQSKQQNFIQEAVKYKIKSRSPPLMYNYIIISSEQHLFHYVKTQVRLSNT
jgi:hypothetical protein